MFAGLLCFRGDTYPITFEEIRDSTCHQAHELPLEKCDIDSSSDNTYRYLRDCYKSTTISGPGLTIMFTSASILSTGLFFMVHYYIFSQP